MAAVLAIVRTFLLRDFETDRGPLLKLFRGTSVGPWIVARPAAVAARPLAAVVQAHHPVTYGEPASSPLALALPPQLPNVGRG